MVAEKARDALRKNMTPIRSDEMSAMMYRLQGHYWQTDMSEALARSVAADYVRLLGHYPLPVFQEAIDSFLLNPKSKYFPKVGELEELLGSKMALKRWRLQRLEKLVEKAE